MSTFRKQAEALTRDAAAKRAEAEKLAALPELSEEQVSQYDALVAEAGEIDAKAAEARARDEAARHNAEQIAAYKAPVTKSVVGDMTAQFSARECVLDDPRLGFANLGEFAQSVFSAGPNEVSSDVRMRAATGMSQGVSADGGFLVPTYYSNMIWDGMRANGVNLLERCDQYVVEGEALILPANAETSRVAGSRYGGIRGYWINEAAQITSSKPTFRQLRLEPKELAVLCYVTDKLLRNAPVALEQYLTRAAGEEIQFNVNDAIVNGTGGGMPLGILTAPCTVSVAAETGQAATTIVKENIDKMWSRLHARSWANAVWLINQDCLPQLQNLSQVVGVGGMPVFLPPGGLSASPYATLYGRPVVPCESCATLGTVGDIILADLSGYAAGVRAGGVAAAASIHLKFDYSETAFRFLMSCDGAPWLGSAITPFKGSNTQSTFVTVATRS